MRESLKTEKNEHPATTKRDSGVCRRWGIVKLELFGSALRDDFRPDSDIDFLYTPGPGFRRDRASVRGSATTWLTNSLHEDTMLIYCSRRVRGLRIHDNIEVKKISRDLLAKCAFEETK